VSCFAAPATDSITQPADAVYYGPHACDCCGETIVRQAIEQGGARMESHPAGPVYPNTQWTVHICKAPLSHPNSTPGTV